MTNAPYAVPKARDGLRLGHGQLVDLMIADGLWDVYNDFHMGNTAELVAKKFEISRGMQDDFAVESHRRAAAAQASGKFAREMAVVEIKDKKGAVTKIDKDEGVRADTTKDGLAKLRPAFDPAGSVTAANASQISDGGSAVIVMSEKAVDARGVSPLGQVVSYGMVAGPDSASLLHQPSGAIVKALGKAGKSIGDIDLFEINEAFSGQYLAVEKELKLDREKVNVNGGSIALGHPLAATGTRLILTLLYELKRRRKKFGIASACIGGGQGIAMIVELIG
jgi:acetyl-CoA C-acetyltransferase